MDNYSRPAKYSVDPFRIEDFKKMDEELKKVFSCPIPKAIKVDLGMMHLLQQLPSTTKPNEGYAFGGIKIILDHKVDGWEFVF